MKILIEQYYRFLKFALTALMALMIVPVALQILSRHTGVIPRYIWTEEAARFCFVWIVMIGSMIAVRDGTHFDVDLLRDPVTPRRKAISRLIVHFCMALMALIFVRYGIVFAKSGYIQNSEMSGINMLSIYISFPLAGLTWLLFLGEKILKDLDAVSGEDGGRESEDSRKPDELEGGA